MDKRQLLNQAREQRADAVMEYQINIDNFTAAITAVRKSGDAELLSKFLPQLEELLRSNVFEQKKEKIMLKVIEDQLK